MKKILVFTALAGSLWASAATAGDQGFHYDERSVSTATYFAAISNLANAIMFSGLGEKLIISPYERDDWLKRAGYVTRPPMPDMGIIGPVYAAALPVFKVPPDFSNPETLRWQSDSFDRTLEPAAQAWTLLKITSPEFHLQYHALPQNKMAGLMMIPQAKEQARVLEERLLNADGLFAARSIDGIFRDPKPRDQAAVLWAVSNLILAGTSSRDDYWHQAYSDLTDADTYRSLADKAFVAVEKLPPLTAADRAIAIEALGRYALATRDESRQDKSLRLARKFAEALRTGAPGNIEGLSLAVYGLMEAARLLDDDSYAKAAAVYFRSALLPLWEESLGVFRLLDEDAPITYSPTTAGAVIAALNAMRWYGPENLSVEASRLYPKFFENAVIRSGLLRASPLPLVAGKYLETEPPSNFAHPSLPTPKDAGVAPVFASQVTFDNGKWTVTDPVFRTGGAMFLVNMLAMQSEGYADPFLPEDRLNTIR